MPPEAPEVRLNALFLGRRGNRDDLVLPGILAAATRRMLPPLPAASEPSNTSTSERLPAKRGSRTSSESRDWYLARSRS